MTKVVENERRRQLGPAPRPAEEVPPTDVLSAAIAEAKARSLTGD
jgi:hypothetical protein